MPNKITAALARGRQLVKVIDLRLHDKTSYQLLQQIDLTFPPLSLDYTEIRFYQNLTSYQLIKGLLSLSLALTLPALPFFLCAHSLSCLSLDLSFTLPLSKLEILQQ